MLSWGAIGQNDMKGEIMPPNERSGRHTYSSATWRDTLDCVWPWYGIRPDVDGFIVVSLFNHQDTKVAGPFPTSKAAQKWMEKNIAP